MESNENTSTNFLIVNGKKIPVSHEVYRMICEENNHIRYVERTMAMAADCNVEEEVLSSITMERLYEAADQVVRYGAVILRMRFEENCSHREISNRLGIAHQVVDRKMNSLLRYFRENAKKFF